MRQRNIPEAATRPVTTGGESNSSLSDPPEARAHKAAGAGGRKQLRGCVHIFDPPPNEEAKLIFLVRGLGLVSLPGVSFRSPELVLPEQTGPVSLRPCVPVCVLVGRLTCCSTKVEMILSKTKF